MNLETIYRRLPTWAQHSAVSCYGLYWYWARFGPGYRDFVRGFEQRERFDHEQWDAWTAAQLKQCLRIAVTGVPYYQRTWDGDQKKAALAGKLQALPLLDKQTVRSKPDAFVRTDINPGRRVMFHSSGTTGTPVKTIWSLSDLRRSMAVREARCARWAGLSFRLPRATFSGRIVEPEVNSDGPFYRYNLVEGQVYLSPFHLRADTAAQYLTALVVKKVKWITGYATSIYLLAQYTLDNELPAPRLDGIVTASEKLTPAMRQTIERVFNCRVFDEYSCVENACFASECEYNRLHVSPDAGIVEILRPDGSACHPGELGEVVATGFLRQYQPFIRYRLGDFATWSDVPCQCGRALPVLSEIAGRTEDLLRGEDGRLVCRMDKGFVGITSIREAQVIQESVGRIRIKTVNECALTPDEIAVMKHRVRQRLGPTKVGFEQVDHIPRLPSGKFQAVVSRIK